jgi:hypothetical protein
MEKQLTNLLNNIINNKCNFEIDANVLDKYYLLDTSKYLGNDFYKIYKDVKDIYGIDLQSIKYGNNNNKQKIIYQNLLLAVISEKNKKKKIQLIPLIIYLDENRFLYDYLHKIKYFDKFVYDIKDFFIGALNGGIVEFSSTNSISDYHHEKELFKSYKLGIENLNFNQIYKFIDGVEKGIGHKFDKYLDFLTIVTYKYFFEDLLEIVNNKKDLIDILYLINILNIEELLHLSLKSNNYLLKFESIRKSIYFKSNNFYCLNLLSSERVLLTNIIIEFSKKEQIWKQFLNFYFEFPSRNTQLFRPMSNAILEIDKNCISELTKVIKIEKYSNSDSKIALNSLILNIKNDEIQKEILDTLFYRWNNFVDSYDDYLGSILLTDVIDIVVSHTIGFVDKESIIKNINNSLSNIEEINNIWFKNKIKETNYFYKQISKLFVYSFAVEKYKLYELRRQIALTCKNNTILQKESQKTTLQLFKEYHGYML